MQQKSILRELTKLVRPISIKIKESLVGNYFSIISLNNGLSLGKQLGTGAVIIIAFKKMATPIISFSLFTLLLKTVFNQCTTSHVCN